jgi:hypothetical protein
LLAHTAPTTAVYLIAGHFISRLLPVCTNRIAIQTLITPMDLTLSALSADALLILRTVTQTWTFPKLVLTARAVDLFWINILK